MHNRGAMPLPVFLAMLVIAAFAGLIVVIAVQPAKKSDNVTKKVEPPVEWNVSSDLTPSSSKLTVYMLTDLTGQQFLVVISGRGMTTTPYTPQKQSVESKNEH